MDSSRHDSRPEKRMRMHEDIPGPSGRIESRYDSRSRPSRSSNHGSLPSSRTSSRAVSPPWRPDDEDGHYVYELGENLTPKYKIIGKLGEGTFGRVLDCYDREAKCQVAIKVIRSIPKYQEAGKFEIKVLESLHRHRNEFSKSECTSKCRGCLYLREWFMYRNHICMVFDKMGPSLFDFMRKNGYKPFELETVRDFAKQLLQSVSYMHDSNFIHTDLKPENILLKSSEYKMAHQRPKQYSRIPKSTEIKLIDFGSATKDSEFHSSIVSTRHYRAPEVILGLGWTYPCDIWSIGCIIAELVTGDALFQTHENLEHLAMMEQVIGPIPSHMIRKADRRAEKYFRHGRELNWPEGASSKDSIQAVRKVNRLEDLIAVSVERSSCASLTDLLRGLLKFEPSERLNARDALAHPFFREPSRKVLPRKRELTP